MSKGIKVKIKTQPAVVLEAEVARKIRQHARSSMKAEVCGVLLGTAEDDRTVVEACVAGINAAQGGAHVTFTQDTWEHIYKIKDQQFPDMKIVGWYHSHPGFGVFLSEHDLFIQENFFSSPQQIAWVYDPHTDEEGCFGWIGGKIEKLPGIRFGYSQNVEAAGPSADNEEFESADLDSVIKLRPVKPADEAAWVKWASRILISITLLALGFAAGLYLWKLSPWAQSALTPVLDAVQQLELQQRFCEPELLACQSRMQRNPFNIAPPAGTGNGTANPQPTQPESQQPQQSPQPKGKDSGNAGKGTNGKH